jgi:phospholipid-translocating ATPase
MSSSSREIIINAGSGDHRFPVNKVHTSKYTLLTFFPYFIYDQFSKPANMFFLAISLLQVSEPVQM